MGVLVGGALQIEAGRRGRLAGQQLDAATAFQVTGTAFFTALERRARELNLEKPSTAAEKEAWLAASRDSAGAAREDARTLLGLLARIELVFPPSIAERAGMAIGGVHELLAILDDEGKDRGDEFGKQWETAIDSFAGFRKAAYEVFSRPIWSARR